MKTTLNKFIEKNMESLQMIISGAYLCCYNRNRELFHYQDDLKAVGWKRLITQFSYIEKKFNIENNLKITVGLRWYIYKLAYHEMLQYIKTFISKQASNIIRDVLKKSTLQKGQIIPIDGDGKYVASNSYELPINRLNTKFEILRMLEIYEHKSRISKNERLFVKVLKECIENGKYLGLVGNRQNLVDLLEQNLKIQHLARKTLEIYLSRITKYFKEEKNV